ncbi:hypothetical protein CDCA_CDCA04G1251 [Cyanidium caldarium]|uniref:CYTH domain-containing protein n=1 Tax=Cyanidium caldarium TaxID=2771 RepID=A0AAV9IT35_CYACA|nr:hypothetical protein CDCA_CDCA04G1251 [Cyanidium caldarium]
MFVARAVPVRRAVVAAVSKAFAWTYSPVGRRRSGRCTMPSAHATGKADGNVEIERKFLVRDRSFLEHTEDAHGHRYQQGYLCADDVRTVRVRRVGDSGYLTIKGKTRGASRAEYEYTIPPSDAQEMLDALCPPPLIEKVRYRVPATPLPLVWEVDVFDGENAGLVVAEIELPHEDATFERPPWIGREVTGTTRYYNASLQRYPFSAWTVQERAEHDAGCKE